MSGEPEVTSSSPDASVGVARPPMGQDPHRLCSANHRSDDLSHCRFPFKVDRGSCGELRYISKKLQLVFSTHGLPEVIVSVNGTAFTSEEFAAFVHRNGIKHLTSAPYHPASNGLAERAVQTLKKALKKDPG